MTRVLHVIHSTKVGGVEVAAAHLLRSFSESDHGVDYRLMALAPGKDKVQAVAPHAYAAGLNHPLSVVSVLRYVKKFKPEVIVTSLWRSALVGLVVNFFFPHVKWVIWLHSTQYSNILDKWSHKLALMRVHEVFCDSEAARDALVPHSIATTVKIVRPMVMQKEERVSTKRNPLSMVYWGRLARRKGLDRSAQLLSLLDEFSLDLYGPDEDTWDRLWEEAQALGVSDRLRWHGAVHPNEIPGKVGSATFFLQLSESEGMGMSVVEAMHLGLIPIVTPVGEIGTYSIDGVSAIHVDSRDLVATSDRILNLAADAERREKMSKNARSVDSYDFAGTFADEVKAMVK